MAATPGKPAGTSAFSPSPRSSRGPAPSLRAACSPTSWCEHTAVNLAHLHLVINHVPTIGSVAALGILLLGYARRNEHLKHVGLEVLFIVALLTLPVYVSGAAGYFEIRETPGVSIDSMRLHQDVALFGFIWMMITGFVAWAALWTWRRRGRPA